MSSICNFTQWAYNEIVSYDTFGDRLITFGLIFLTLSYLCATLYYAFVKPVLNTVTEVVKYNKLLNKFNKTDKKEEVNNDRK